ncbi:MAG: isoprenylcysteine carboxylmethyltransferase family protein [Magnetococcales bacterium]|nr:isoprenylcysteine carboxylmethyltransferase family protein [Magnetococcales bacterium]
MIDVEVGQNLLWLFVFAAHHSLAARPFFKAWLTRFLPPHLERLAYVLTSALLLVLVLWQWRPLPTFFWQVASPPGRLAVGALFLLGLAIALEGVRLTDGQHLLGIRQIRDHRRGQRPVLPGLQTRSLYRWMRHPIMTGTLILLWARPQMNGDHLLLALFFTGYIVVGTLLEERDLLTVHGEEYARYRREVPMFLPFNLLSIKKRKCSVL